MPAIGTSLAPYLPLVEGKEVGGEIVDFRIQQKSDYDTNRPLYFVRLPDGKATKGFEPYDADGKPNEPITDFIFTVETGIEDEQGETERRIFLDPRKGKRGTDVEGKRGLDAVEKALKVAKAHRVGLEIGGKIFITRGPLVAPKRGDAKCVTFTARYEPPAGGVGTGTPVSDVQHMIGGGVYNPNEREQVQATSFIPPVARGGVTASGLGQNGGSVVMAAAKEDEEPPF